VPSDHVSTSALAAGSSLASIMAPDGQKDFGVLKVGRRRRWRKVVQCRVFSRPKWRSCSPVRRASPSFVSNRRVYSPLAGGQQFPGGKIRRAHGKPATARRDVSAVRRSGVHFTAVFGAQYGL
jgi:hypothetical protein